MKYIATVDGRDLTIDIDRSGEILVDGEALTIDLLAVDTSAEGAQVAQTYSLIVDNKSHELFVERRAGAYEVVIDGDLFSVEVEDARLKQLKAMGGEGAAESSAAAINAPMPGMVVKVLVEPGQMVEANAGLVILEAMKMENELRSPIAGVVKSVSAVAGQTVNQGDPLVTVDAEPEDEADAADEAEGGE